MGPCCVETGKSASLQSPELRDGKRKDHKSVTGVIVGGAPSGSSSWFLDLCLLCGNTPSRGLHSAYILHPPIHRMLPLIWCFSGFSRPFYYCIRLAPPRGSIIHYDLWILIYGPTLIPSSPMARCHTSILVTSNINFLQSSQEKNHTVLGWFHLCRTVRRHLQTRYTTACGLLREGKGSLSVARSWDEMVLGTRVHWKMIALMMSFDKRWTIVWVHNY